MIDTGMSHHGFRCVRRTDSDQELQHELTRSSPPGDPGATRDAIVAFLDAAADVPVEQRVACFDNDGTLWCERPTYVQFDFFVDAMKAAVQADPSARRAAGVRGPASAATRPRSARSASSGSPTP